jgi:GNAT superfamily N-acetyltransferase
MVTVVELRPTTVADLPALYALFVAAINGVFEPHGFAPPGPRLDVFVNQQQHLLDTGTSVLAEDDGRLLGFGASWQRDEHWFLASLFVDEAAQGRGVGAGLLDAVWGAAAKRRTITDAIQPVSNALYARHGLIPATPILTFTGHPRSEGRGVRPEAADVAAVDLAAYGFDRSVDHAYWQQHGRLTTWPGAYSYVFPGGAIGPVAGLDAGAAARALAAELARADGKVRVRIPGSSRALVEVALASGLRLEPVPGLLLLSETVQPATALAIAGYMLF